jgi:hypothetical protein
LADHPGCLRDAHDGMPSSANFNGAFLSSAGKHPKNLLCAHAPLWEGTMTTEYYVGNNSAGIPQWAYWDDTQSQWVLTTTPPGQGDDGILGGPQPTPPSGGPPLPQTLPQSGTVSFYGETTTDVGVLTVDGAGPWTIVGTGGTNSTINSLVVAMGATVTVASGGAIAVQNVVIQQAPGITTPATVTLGDGLAPGDAIDFQNQSGLTYASAFDGTHTNITVSSGSAVVGNISLMGNAQLGPAISDGAGGTEIVVQGTQPVIGTTAANTPFAILAVADGRPAAIPLPRCREQGRACQRRSGGHGMGLPRRR